jgi:subtilisin family serine protease
VPIVGLLCGILWWGVSGLLGAGAYGIWGTHRTTGLIAGVVTGVITTAVSALAYRRLSVKSLYWYSPVSVYGAIAVYGLAIFLLRALIADFKPGQIPWAVGLQGIFGMWWGVTILLPLGLAVHALAYFNHRALRKLLLTGNP